MKNLKTVVALLCVAFVLQTIVCNQVEGKSITKRSSEYENEDSNKVVSFIIYFNVVIYLKH
jgi:hypothetical protein